MAAYSQPKPPELTSAQLDLGLMPNAIWNPGKLRGNSLQYKASAQADSLWKLPYTSVSPTAHLVYAVSWMSEATFGNRTSPWSSVKSLIAPSPYDYRVQDAMGGLVQNWGRDSFGLGIDVSLFVNPKCRGNQSCSYWSTVTPNSDRIWFKDNGRLCKPLFFNPVRNASNSGTGSHSIEIGYGDPNGMTNIMWVAKKNFIMLPQNQIFKINSSIAKIKLPTTFYGISGEWIAPQQNGAATVINPSSAKMIRYYEPGVSTAKLGLGWGYWNDTNPSLSIISNIGPNCLSSNGTPLFKGVFINKDGTIILNKSSLYSASAASVMRGITKGRVPLNLIFRTANVINHSFTLWLEL